MPEAPQCKTRSCSVDESEVPLLRRVSQRLLESLGRRRNSCHVAPPASRTFFYVPAPLSFVSVPLSSVSAPLSSVSAPLSSVSAPLSSVPAPLSSVPAPLSSVSAPLISVSASLPSETISAPSSTAFLPPTSSAPLSSASPPHPSAYVSHSSVVILSSAPLPHSSASVLLSSASIPFTSASGPRSFISAPHRLSFAHLNLLTASCSSDSVPSWSHPETLSSSLLTLNSTPHNRTLGLRPASSFIFPSSSEFSFLTHASEPLTSPTLVSKITKKKHPSNYFKRNFRGSIHKTRSCEDVLSRCSATSPSHADHRTQLNDFDDYRDRYNNEGSHCSNLTFTELQLSSFENSEGISEASQPVDDSSLSSSASLLVEISSCENEFLPKRTSRKNELPLLRRRKLGVCGSMIDTSSSCSTLTEPRTSQWRLLTREVTRKLSPDPSSMIDISYSNSPNESFAHFGSSTLRADEPASDNYRSGDNDSSEHSIRSQNRGPQYLRVLDMLTQTLSSPPFDDHPSGSRYHAISSSCQTEKTEVREFVSRASDSSQTVSKTP
ncbi:flocculation protein FLO11-like [Hyalella azteca]|uniref:Flocculation protein FLO11-like n=1 Tax=Hyalella azteca TaxID=294128 RepID=A0A979FWS9_HYAAZ|nr:flocculation protein FLO11-like [Hyalella azteca]